MEENGWSFIISKAGPHYLISKETREVNIGTAVSVISDGFRYVKAVCSGNYWVIMGYIHLFFFQFNTHIKLIHVKWHICSIHSVEYILTYGYSNTEFFVARVLRFSIIIYCTSCVDNEIYEQRNVNELVLGDSFRKIARNRINKARSCVLISNEGSKINVFVNIRIYII